MSLLSPTEGNTSPPPAPESPSKVRFWKNKKIMIIVGALAVAASIVSIGIWRGRTVFRPKVQYAAAYSLAPDKISQSAAIVITLPEGVGKEVAREKITFNPEIAGSWREGDNERQLIFQPSKKLKLGRYYAVTLALDSGTIGKDFLVDEDPKVAGVFPRAESETDENSNITVMFNRPMIPLTTLEQMDEKQIPVKIEPQTEGTFKWIGTHTVQFVPKERLTRSSNYKVSIASDVVSVDGLKPEPMEAKFTTRLLRYAYLYEGYSPLVYNRPFQIQFNQPIDLERTREKILVKDTTDDKDKELVVEYGKRGEFNVAKQKYEDVEDRSVVLIYNKKDMNGRVKFWDVTHAYLLKISGAIPEEGDITLNEAREINFSATDIIASVSAESERSSHVRPEFFDPVGTLVLRFFEDIDIKRSVIQESRSKNITYGEKCADPTQEGNKDCAKEPDKKELRITFDATRIAKEEALALTVKSIANTDGVTINARPIVLNIKTFPALAVIKTQPANNVSGALVDNLILCANSPLAVPAKEDVKDAIQTSPEYEFKSWDRPYRAGQNDSNCPEGAYVTRISYGLMPETVYKVKLKLTDDFGQTLDKELSFTTGKLPDYYVNFYHFQQRYNVTTPDKTELTFAAENMEYVNMDICTVSAETMLYGATEDILAAPENMNGCLSHSAHRIELGKKYWIKNFFTVDLKKYIANPLGHYILTFSHPQYRQAFQKDGKPVYDRTYLTVTNLSVVEKRVEVWDQAGNGDYNIGDEQRKKLTNLYWVTNLKTLQPVDGAHISLYSSVREEKNTWNVFGIEKKSEIATAADGVGRTVPVNDQYGVIVSSGNDSAVLKAQSKFGWTSTATRAQKMYVYTDRPIYRPTHEVDIKGLFRIGYDGKYEIFKDKKIPLKVFDSGGKEILSQELEVNDFGTFNTKLTLDLAAPLGTYRIEADSGRGYATFEVEEYVPAAFELKAKTDKGEYIAGDTFKVNVDANYYFGAPVDGGTVDYTLVAQNYYFDKYQDEYFQFGKSWYDCFNDCYYGDKFLLRSKVDLDRQGKATLSAPIDFAKFFPKTEERSSKIFVLYVTAKNSAGQSVSTQKSFIVHAGEYYLGLRSDSSFVGKDQTIAMKIKSVDTNGKPLGIDNITLTYSRVRYEYNKRREVDGGYYYTWERKLDEKKKVTIDTNRDGNAEDEFVPKEEGEYEIAARGTDKRGNVIMSSYNVYVYGEGAASVKPTNDQSLELVVEKSNVAVGDTASVIIKSPYEKAKALVTIERGQIFSYEIIDINQNFYRYNFPITETFIPNIYVTVVLLSDKPEVRHGQVSFSVNTKEKDLNVSVKSNKEQYLPGEEVVLTFAAKDSAGKPAEAEFSAAVVDMSVLALKGNPKKNPVLFFYDGFPLTISTFSNVKNILYKVDVPVGTGNKGGGGGDAGDLAKKKRGDFKDTAFWQAVIRTDKNGTAEARFSLPDNLTTWQTEAVAITKDTKVGAGYDELVARKPLMAVPLKPRFVIPGDEFSVGATIANQTGQRQKVSVTLKDATFTLLEKSARDVVVPANESKTVYFKAQAPANVDRGEHKFVIVARARQYEDTVEQTFKIARNETYETTATAGYSTAEKVTETIFVPNNVVNDRGGVTVKSSATLAVFLSDAIKTLLEFPYGSGEQIASKLQAIAIVKQAQGVKNLGGALNFDAVEFNGKTYTLEQAVNIGLANLYRHQNNDGGFLYYPRGTYFNYYSVEYSSICLSAHVAETFGNLEAAGYKIDQVSKDRLQRYLEGEALRNDWQRLGNDAFIAVAGALQTITDREFAPGIMARLQEIIKDKKYLGDEISNTSLALLATLLQESKQFGPRAASPIYDRLDNRLEIDSRGTYLGVAKNLFWEYYETPVRNTALYLKALSVRKKQNEIVDGVLRWLLASKAKDGSWGSTVNSLGVIDAMTDYLVWTRETESDFTLTTLLNNNEKQSATFATGTVMAQNEFTIPVADLKRNELNSLEWKKANHNRLKNTFYYDAAFRYFLPVNTIPPRDEGFAITRSVYRLDDRDNKSSVTDGKVGEVLRVRDEIIVPRSRNFVAIEDFIPAGAEIVNLNLATEDQSVNVYQTDEERKQNEWRAREPKATMPLYPSVQESRDDRVYMAVEQLQPGTYTFDYYIRLLIPGKYNHLPAVVSENYFPENFGRTAGGVFEVK